MPALAIRGSFSFVRQGLTPGAIRMSERLATWQESQGLISKFRFGEISPVTRPTLTSTTSRPMMMPGLMLSCSNTAPKKDAEYRNQQRHG